jgi:hypothetical protein
MGAKVGGSVGEAIGMVRAFPPPILEERSDVLVPRGCGIMF